MSQLVLLKTIILWSLHSSEAISSTLKAAYKQTRRDDDRNQPKAVQPWFSDTWRRKYYLIEGQEDTHFRIYRENDGKTAKTNQWFSVAGTIDEAKALAERFETEMPGNQGRLIAEKVRMAVPRWEAGEEKRKRKEYRAARKAAFSRPEAGFGLYEGRTRGKRLRYTYEDGVDEFEDSEASLRRSGRSTPAFDDGGPVVTSSGRQVKSRLGGMYGETLSIDQRREAERDRVPSSAQSEDTDDMVVGANGRPLRKSIPTKRAAAARGRYADGLESESETDGDAEPSADEWNGDVDEPDEESDADAEGDDDDDLDEDDELMDDGGTQESLVVQLRYRKAPAAIGHGGTNGVNGTGPPKASPLVQVENASDVANETKALSLNSPGDHDDAGNDAQAVDRKASEKPIIPVSTIVNGHVGETLQAKDGTVSTAAQPVQPMDVS